MSQKKYIFEKIEYRAVIKYLFLKGNSSKEIYDDMKKTLSFIFHHQKLDF